MNPEFERFVEFLKTSPWVKASSDLRVRVELRSYTDNTVKISLSDEESFPQDLVLSEDDFYQLFKIESSLLNG